MTASVDILIPTYNRPAALAVTLTGLAAQTYRDFRVVVSDQSDNAESTRAGEVRAVVRLLRAHGHTVDLLPNLPRRGMAAQRQFLLDQASAPYALFLDDDLILEPWVVGQMHVALREGDCGFVGEAVLGLSYLPDHRPHQQAIEFWEGPVQPEIIRPDTPEWERYVLHNAANLYHVQERLGLTPETTRKYKIAWVGGCVMYDVAKLHAIGGFGFWQDLPPEACGEDVLAQFRVMARYGGCGLIPSGVYHQELPTTVPDRSVNAPRVLGIEAPAGLAQGGSTTMYTLGINAAFHDSAACLVQDGRVIAAAEDERFTHIKHGKRPTPFETYQLPFHAIDYCLREAGIRITDVDHIAYSFDPYLLLKGPRDAETMTLPLEPSAHPTPDGWDSPWEPLFVSYIVNAPRHLVGGVPLHLRARLGGFRLDGPTQWHFVEHHTAHAASAFHASPFERAAVLTLDGRGEKATTSYSLGDGNRLERLGQVDFPHSLGMLYEQATAYLGFLHSSDEYKVMALASFGQPTYLDEFREMIQIGDNGQYTIAQGRLEDRFGPAREKGGPLEQRHYDIAHSLQKALEESALRLATWLHEATGESDLCLAGGVALNCVMNAHLRDHGPFRRIWVQPAAGDAGTALGAAIWVDAQERRSDTRSYHMDHAFLGPSYSEAEIEEFLRWTKVPYRRLTDIAEETADLLAADKVIGWYQGRMEFGPRALGARSILASPVHAELQAKLNEIKDREDFRPVAPVVLEEEADSWFVGAKQSPFMLFIYDVLPDKADQIPAVRHVDGTARIQTINRDQHALYYDLLKAFQARTGVPVLVNTSFNTRGEPIVCTPRDAVECFWTSPLDALVIGPFLLEKSRP